jgi:hypothetical protein
MKLAKSKSILYCVVLSTALLFSATAFCADISSSVWKGIGEGAHGENGVVIIGVNPNTKILSGYYESSDITGNITAECKFFFSGKVTISNVIPVKIVTAYPAFVEDKSAPINGKIEALPGSNMENLAIYPSKIPRSCDWLYSGLPSYVPPIGFTLESGLANEFSRKGDWQAVDIIRSKRAYFHSQPNDNSKGKAFVVAGDVIYIYAEDHDWYYAKFRNTKKETSGWIRKIDTIQLPN